MMFSVESKACFEWKFHRNRDEKNDLLGVTDSNYFLFISSFFQFACKDVQITLSLLHKL